MIQEEIVGKLTYVAKTAGLHLNDQPKWYNPSPEAKEKILPKIEELTKLIGSQVKLRIEDTGDYKSVEVIKDTNEVQIEQNIQDEKESKEAPAPSKKIEKKESEVKNSEPLNWVSGTFTFEPRQIWDQEYFNKLNTIGCEVAKKNNLTYISWATAWEALKKVHPDATFQVHEDQNGMPYFADTTGAFAKVSVTVCGITHTVHLPVMDYKNAAMKKEDYSFMKWDNYKKQEVEVKVKAYDTFDINKTIQRALAKAIACHGLGLYVYRGEDFPSE